MFDHIRCMCSVCGTFLTLFCLLLHSQIRSRGHAKYLDKHINNLIEHSKVVFFDL